MLRAYPLSSQSGRHSVHHWCTTYLMFSSTQLVTLCKKVSRKCIVVWNFNLPAVGAARIPPFMHPQVAIVFTTYLMFFSTQLVTLSKKVFSKYIIIPNIQLHTFCAPRIPPFTCREADIVCALVACCSGEIVHLCFRNSICICGLHYIHTVPRGA